MKDAEADVVAPPTLRVVAEAPRQPGNRKARRRLAVQQRRVRSEEERRGLALLRQPVSRGEVTLAINTLQRELAGKANDIQVALLRVAFLERALLAAGVLTVEGLREAAEQVSADFKAEVERRQAEEKAKAEAAAAAGAEGQAEAPGQEQLQDQEPAPAVGGEPDA